MSGAIPSLFPARDQALELLDELCQHGLDVPLSHVESLTGSDLREYDTSAKFKWLRDLIVENINA